MRRMSIGLQMHTVRGELAKDFTGTLRRVAELGYEGIEFAGYGGLSAEELKDLLQELNLKAIGAHVSITKMKADLNKEIEYLRAIDAPYLICPHIAAEDRQTPEAWQSLFAYFAETGGQVKEQGLQFAYHNHAFEFEMKINDQFAFDAMATNEKQVPSGIMDAFVESVVTNTSPSISGEEGLKSLEVILAAFESQDSKKVVTLS
ncbi:TIM barrel protein [Paenibacillus sp.]|uniref:sugar phosphate isomerase/epimerase family protein n=1 Tax=Paenibacillus sp. TaxID=58172 RepID=UPI0028AAB34E|nr:TIM barrel protein [Paenibacillus sp.]